MIRRAHAALVARQPGSHEADLLARRLRLRLLLRMPGRPWPRAMLRPVHLRTLPSFTLMFTFLTLFTFLAFLSFLTFTFPIIIASSALGATAFGRSLPAGRRKVRELDEALLRVMIRPLTILAWLPVGLSGTTDKRVRILRIRCRRALPLLIRP